MTTRRTFIKTLAAVPPLLSFDSGWAASDPSRQALVIGNSAYRDSPLGNPVNDATAVSSLFSEAGFTVDSRLNATRADMVEAIDRFGKSIKRSETKLAVFYFAGHGAQLDWRNYLLPVDVVVKKQDELKQYCIDLNYLLGELAKAKEKTFVVILDACRNNPFGRDYQPDRKGLSQFDAPVGSLLAYSTAPGSVASDGEGQYGLYTENLVRELSRRNTRIEDALKRVRLNVRLASRGEQIPWETTSLESDLFLFNQSPKALTEAEQEALLEAEHAEWTRIRSSRSVDDWAGYLGRYPNGRFAEIAQTRLTRLLVDIERQSRHVAQASHAKAAHQNLGNERAPNESPMPAQRYGPEVAAAVSHNNSPDNMNAAPPHIAAAERSFEDLMEETRIAAERIQNALDAATPPPYDSIATNSVAKTKMVVPAAPTILIRAGIPVPQLIPRVDNPFSAGRFPLGRAYSPGDVAEFEISDLLTGVRKETFTLRVLGVDPNQDRVELSGLSENRIRAAPLRGRMLVTDLMGNIVEDGKFKADVPQQFVPSEFYLGKKWKAAFRRIDLDQPIVVTYDFQIVKREAVSVPAGTFDAFLVEGLGWNGFGARLDRKSWMVPGLNFSIKEELIVREPVIRGGRYSLADRIELASLKQHATEIASS